MPGGKAIITITPSAGEPNQFDLSAADSIPLQGESIVAVAWYVPLPGFAPYTSDKLTFHNEFDYHAAVPVPPASYQYTVCLDVLFSDGTTDRAIAALNVPHSVV